MAESFPETWTTRDLLRWMTHRFEEKGIDAPRVVAEMLLGDVFECERMRLYMDVDRPASSEELATLRQLVVRASAHEPVQYLVGRASFLGREFLVDRSTMIPQPCTEDLVDWVLQRFKGLLGYGDPAEAVEGCCGPVIADVGTGSGCIAVSLAARMPTARLVATDKMPEALELARRNAERFNVVDRIEFLEGVLLEPLKVPAGVRPFDMICSNPPYIPDHEWEAGLVQASVREHVPASALRGGSDGLDFIRPLIAGAGGLLRSGGRLVIEIAHCQKDEVIDLVDATEDLHLPQVLVDYEGYWRLLTAEKIKN